MTFLFLANSVSRKGERTMVRFAPCLLILLALVGCDHKPAPQAAAPKKDPRITAIEQRIAQTTPEGKQILEKVQAMKPEVNEQASGKTLKELVDDYAKNKGDYNLSPIGWEASQKKSGKWKVGFDFQDWQKQIQAAEWEFDPQANKLYPFEFQQAPG